MVPIRKCHPKRRRKVVKKRQIRPRPSKVVKKGPNDNKMKKETIDLTQSDGSEYSSDADCKEGILRSR